MSIIPILKAKEVLLLLRRLGFRIVAQKGSHIKIEHLVDKSRKAIIPFHNKDLTRGILLSVLKQAKVPLKEFLKLLGR